ncbi:MAG: NUDIX hydrolase [Bernardetiaceae bacterium]|jgi:ADP-ribose pyrophosphatase YjhB (NUDIX family)|nr:NUDIX hydrolase [Bernardetiaceae bacterium]
MDQASSPERFWLAMAQRVQAIAQAGLFYSPNPYDLDRFEELTQLSVQMLARLAADGPEPGQIRQLMTADVGYRTPKTDVRAVVLRQGRLLLVQEREDGRWALPGGWADVGLSPRENVEKEVREEAGLLVRATRLLAVMDKKMHPHALTPNYVYKLFFLCEETGGQLEQGMETTGADFFDPAALPPLSEDRNLPSQIATVLALAAQPSAPPYFD